MEAYGFLTLVNLSEAKRIWNESSVYSLAEQAQTCLLAKEAQGKKLFDEYLLENDSEDTRRRIGIIKEFEEMGIAPDDPGLLYLKDLLYRPFEEAQMAAHPFGIPAPHLSGLKEISAALQGLAERIDPRLTLQDLFSLPTGESTPATPADYFEKLLELQSRWMSPLFPLTYLHSDVFCRLSKDLKKPLAFSLPDRSDGKDGGARLPVVPLPMPLSGCSSTFFLLDKALFRDAYLSLAEPSISLTQHRLSLTDEEKSQLDLFLGSFDRILQELEQQPACELLLVVYREQYEPDPGEI